MKLRTVIVPHNETLEVDGAWSVESSEDTEKGMVVLLAQGGGDNHSQKESAIGFELTSKNE